MENNIKLVVLLIENGARIDKESINCAKRNNYESILALLRGYKYKNIWDDSDSE